jgi:hypothetical protein
LSYTLTLGESAGNYGDFEYFSSSIDINNIVFTTPEPTAAGIMFAAGFGGYSAHSMALVAVGRLAVSKPSMLGKAHLPISAAAAAFPLRARKSRLNSPSRNLSRFMAPFL